MAYFEPMKKRHGFVTFWLYLGIIVNVIVIITSIMSYQNLSNLGYLGMELINDDVDLMPFSNAIHSHILILQVFAALSGILMITGYALLLNWKKAGFWLLAITAVVVAVINVIMMNYIKQDYALLGLTINWNPITQLVVTPVSIFILWAILQLKADGVSCWQQLEPSGR